MNVKKIKTNFTIKLSTETVQKLKENEDTDLDRVTNEGSASLAEPELKLVDEKISATPKDVDRNTSPSYEPTDDNQSKSTDITEFANNKDISVLADKTDPKLEIDNRWGDYTPYITYENEIAIYTDPNTNIRYTWNQNTSNWEQKDDQPKDSAEERVYSYENETHLYTEADGSKFFWDDSKKAWFPKIDDDFLAQYQMSYGFVDNTTKVEDKKEEAEVESEKTATVDVAADTEKGNVLGKRKLPEDPKWFDVTDNVNTKVYVSNLPLDITEEEFVDFMQKCGLVMRDPTNQKMKVKLYADKETNQLKGDALCCYIKIESVELALNLLDGSDIRGNKVSVQRAQFQMKGDYNPALKPKKKRKKDIEKLKKMQEKLFDWRPEKLKGERSKHERVVVIKNLFDPKDFDKDVKLILDYQQDMREECAKCGEVRSVRMYDRHPEGVAQVTMKEPEEAEVVVKLINGRWFGKRQLTAEIWDGRTKYKIAETDADINKRVENWEKFLVEDEHSVEKKDQDTTKPVE